MLEADACQIGLNLGAAGNQLAMEKRNGRLDELVEVNRLGLVLAFFKQIAQSHDNIAGPIVLVNDIADSIAYIDEIW